MVLKSILSEAAEKLFAGKCPKLICITPLPRYITEKCCESPDHIQNFTGNDYYSEINQNAEEVEELISGWAQNINGRSEVVNFRMVADDPEQELLDLTVHGEQLWAPGDPVHGSGSDYQEMATLV
jgi:predicted AlkP superfamily phosphohydrolase/phosphomutase